jgi:hypothetical protein
LANSNWEKEIINHFVQSNTDPKIAEQLRLVDIDNMAKYFPSTNDQNLKSDVLVELLRSASVENNRVEQILLSIYLKNNRDKTSIKSYNAN